MTDEFRGPADVPTIHIERAYRTGADGWWGAWTQPAATGIAARR